LRVDVFFAAVFLAGCFFAVFFFGRSCTSASSPRSARALTHRGEQDASLLMLMAKSRHKKPENVRRHCKPSPEAISELTSLLAPGDARR
jgi:hypothetical protein